eukprot:TRINITY_DN1992_c0_g1_i1.p1 TRINITY_DN1992_c0_g1~~TRINITY_DN1992_c0_g1_i1.p1  ORF type:complete len:659 (-),score=107.30 TRINITY_DN1992_c0_g1_i1:431-2407(-)
MFQAGVTNAYQKIQDLFPQEGSMANGRPSSPKHNQEGGRKWNYSHVAGLVALVLVGYVVGNWHGRWSAPDYKVFTDSPASSCNDLDFSTHHSKGSKGNALQVFPACDVKLSEYTPCQDAKRSIAFPREKLIYRERHCPTKAELLKCLIPAPPGYKNPFPWPQSRDESWYANVPHKHLTVEKAIQNWIQFEGDRFRFPGGGTMFPHGADVYIEEINAIVKLTKGDIRTALDTGCGVASFGAYLLDRQVLTMSFAPRDTHEAQVQFALERGVPAMLVTMASMRLPYPARSFDLAHCSRCLIPWQNDEGLYLAEIDRVLRPGGYWVLSGPPVNWLKHWKGWQRTKKDLKAEMDAIEGVAKRLCWEKVDEVGNLAVWRKPINHLDCKEIKMHGDVEDRPPFCPKEQNPDSAWYTKMEGCITELPEVIHRKSVAGGKLAKWPLRLTDVPPRIQSGSLHSVTADSFKKDTELWHKRVAYYKTRLVNPLSAGRFRNIMDMNSGLGGFAANLDQEKTWVMNTVSPSSKEDTLGVIYERGLIGTYQDWCEAFSTYPRTYDMIHADRLFTLYDTSRCDFADILLEMDRILRPEGAVVIRDDVDVLIRVRNIIRGMRWKCRLADHEDGPFNHEKILVCLKSYWVADAPASDDSSPPKPHVTTAPDDEQH